jgi:LysM repeat protein
MRTLEEDETYEVPDFAVEAREPQDAATPGASGGSDDALSLGDLGDRHEETFDEVPLTGDTYPVSGADRRRDHLHHRGQVRHRSGVEPRPRGGVGVTILLVVLALALVAALGYVAYRLIWGPPITSFSSLFCPPTVESTAAPAEPTGPAEPAATEPATPVAAAAPATDAAAATTGDPSTATPASTTTATSAGVTYRIRRGDTLWDLSSTYYRNPWLYPVIASANGIKNPDLIIAGARIFIPER